MLNVVSWFDSMGILVNKSILVNLEKFLEKDELTYICLFSNSYISTKIAPVEDYINKALKYGDKHNLPLASPLRLNCLLKRFHYLFDK